MTVYWICTDVLHKGGRKIMGPFVDKSYAFEMRGKLELLNAPVTYWIDADDPVSDLLTEHSDKQNKAVRGAKSGGDKDRGIV